jgi:coenzyme F420-0:L-glutamate ligase/coenzyme F420-1:gamma-L-glutamate ligase
LRPIEIFAIQNMPLIKEGDNIADIIVTAAQRQNTPITNKDIVVITHKIVSKAEGNIVNLEKVSPSERAIQLAQKTEKDPKFVEIVLRETKEIVRTGHNSLITETKNGTICANAGIDKSNIEGKENIALLPREPDKSARSIRREIRKLTNQDVAVVISDTHGRPLRMGEINVAIGIAGMKPTKDRRGEKDLFGYVLRVKQTAIADEIASAAELVIGQADEGRPVAIVRGYEYSPAEKASARELIRPREADLFR